jgi:hypothetical protein
VGGWLAASPCHAAARPPPQVTAAHNLRVRCLWEVYCDHYLPRAPASAQTASNRRGAVASQGHSVPRNAGASLTR